MSSTPGLSAPELWPHQREAVDAALTTLAKTERTTVVMACGTGKTRVGSEIAQRIELSADHRVLVVVPTIELVGQTLHAWRQAHGSDALGRVVALCSDTGVMDARGQELKAERAAVTTSPQHLAHLTAGPGRVTVVSTYAGLRVLESAHADHGLRPWNLMIVDEAHRTAGAAAKSWARVHDDALLPAGRRLYLTATPKIVADHGDTGRGDLSVSMDDEKVYGPVSFKMSFARAAELGLLADYQLIIAVTTSEEVRALAAEQGARHYQVGRSAVSVEVLARQIAVLRAAEQHDISRMITYHGRVADAEWFAKTLPAVAPLLGEDGIAAPSVWAGHVHGGQGVVERRGVLDRLRGDEAGLVVVANARVLTEGVDTPEVAGIAFLDPRESVIDIIQALGRAMRLGGRQSKTASIIVPILLGPDEDPVDALEGSDFRQVWRIARALRAHDEALGEQLDRSRLRLGTSSYQRTGPVRELPDWLKVNGIEVPPHFAAAITARAVRTTTPAWEEYYGAAQVYRQAQGDLDIPQPHTTPAGLRLGEWLSRQRVSEANGELQPGRRKRLEDLGIIWAPRADNWERQFTAAEDYYRENGHLRVPRGHMTEGPDPVDLGAFIRGLRSSTGGFRLDPERRAALDAIGMVWSVQEDAWQRNLTAARTYHRQNGNLLVPKDFVTDDDPPVSLGQWITWLRCTRNKQSPERRQELNRLDMVWSVYDYQWQRSFDAAADYYEAHGHLHVPTDHKTAGPDPIRLGSWVYRQRAQCREGKLTPERIAALAKIGLRW
ncbi:Helicase associated domain protein [Streptomyces sp. NPDC059142]|uniref:DEAD/DEAH box helicase n=1 Tax=Streptomyces sp. NPDC059142 TaxID=3346739 RepID=UPI0036B16143